MSYITGHKLFTSQYILNIYIYCRLYRSCIINVCTKLLHAKMFCYVLIVNVVHILFVNKLNDS
jgi:hypothetical protein